MVQSYLIKRIISASEIPWDTVERANIAHFPWDENGYRPQALAQMCHTNDALHIRLTAVEEKLRAVCCAMNEPVYTDSCLEFFLSPEPEKDGRYLNFELNPLGTLLLGIGSGRHDRALQGTDVLQHLEIRTRTLPCGNGRQWSVEFTIPFVFLQAAIPAFIPSQGKKMRGNFYKCGDSTTKPHYGCWNPINLQKPDFHCPGFFGELILE